MLTYCFIGTRIHPIAHFLQKVFPSPLPTRVMSTLNEPVKEGQALAYLPKSVFYNPVQEFNRDLSVAVISEFSRLYQDEKRTRSHKENVVDEVAMQRGLKYDDGLTILEGLAASGLRSVRFAKEIPGLRQVIANDFDRTAVDIMQKNIELNDVADLMSASCNDAALLMYEASRGKFGALSTFGGFDVIDLDPYGSPTQFLDGAVQAIRDGGLLCVTCTDMAILCGNAHEKCFSAYGAVSLRSPTCHEIALRIILRTIDSFANRYGKYIEPLISLSVDFYCRVFVRVRSGPAIVKESSTKTGMVYECTGCRAQHIQPLALMELKEVNGKQVKKFCFSRGPPVGQKCQHCNHTHHIAGPLWIKPLHRVDFMTRVLDSVKLEHDRFGTSDRIIGMLTLAQEELPDVPLYYQADQLCAVVKTSCPSHKIFRSAILNAGYRVSFSHANKKSVKTDAPLHVVWDILRCWAKLHPVKPHHLENKQSACAVILAKEPELQANFILHEEAIPKSKKEGLVRFQTGKKNWGPKAKASPRGEILTPDKRKANQNKRSSKRLKNFKANVDYKKYHCATFKKSGECPYGQQCRYSHTSGSEQPMDDSEPEDSESELDDYERTVDS